MKTPFLPTVLLLFAAPVLAHAQTAPKTGDAAPVIIMSMATQWHDRLLEWVFTSNDAEIFNGITKSLVQFGDGPWGPMFAPNIGPKGSGTPMTVLPRIRVVACITSQSTQNLRHCSRFIA